MCIVICDLYPSVTLEIYLQFTAKGSVYVDDGVSFDYKRNDILFSELKFDNNKLSCRYTLPFSLSLSLTLFSSLYLSIYFSLLYFSISPSFELVSDQRGEKQ